KAVMGNKTVLAGNAAFIKEEKIPFGQTAAQTVDAAAAKGQTPLLFAVNGRLAGMISVADTVRSTSAQALKLLKQMGVETVMLTGDNAATAKAIASGLDLDRVISDVLPADKDSVIQKLQKEGKTVVMVGDGINDAPALMRADVGIAIGAGTDIAVESADLVLMKDNLLDVVTAIELSRKTIQNIKENLFWAFFYNCLGIPVAMGLLYPFAGLLLNPMIGAAAMSLSSVTVCLNALRLRLFKPRNETAAQIASQKVSHAQELQTETLLDDLPEEVLKQAKEEELHSVRILLGGLSCQHCTARVKKALEAVDGVKEAQVSLEPMEALVFFEEIPDPQACINAVKEAGYEAWMPEEADGPAEYELKVNGMSCAHCEARVEKALSGTNGILSVKADAKNGTVVVTASEPLNLEEAKQIIKEAGYEPADDLPKEDYMKIEMTVTGMNCNHCRQSVMKALSGVDGVSAVEVDLATGKAEIETSKPVDKAALAKAVEDAGFGVQE
ncbi:MAG: HAD-IC family P-type ATPase, partial [Erysipelotrichaceae bacterium]|nr:HAD-IC family P-type ATPase [Erysipelotrichaceae bacterium]